MEISGFISLDTLTLDGRGGNDVFMVTPSNVLYENVNIVNTGAPPTDQVHINAANLAGSVVATDGAVDVSYATRIGNTYNAVPGNTVITVKHAPRNHCPASAAFASVASDAPAAATPAALFKVAIDAVFTSYQRAEERTVAPSARPWAWLAAMESSWNSLDQNKTTVSAIAAWDSVPAWYGI